MFCFNQRPSSLEGFTQPISNDRGHILPGIPRSSKCPWGDFVGTWDMTKPPLRTKTMKTAAMASNVQNSAPLPTGKERTPSPKQEAVTNKARSPTPQQENLRTPSPRDGANPRPQSQEKKSPSPIKPKTPEVPATPSKSPTQESAPQKQVVLCDPS